MLLRIETQTFPKQVLQEAFWNDSIGQRTSLRALASSSSSLLSKRGSLDLNLRLNKYRSSWNKVTGMSLKSDLADLMDKPCKKLEK